MILLGGYQKRLVTPLETSSSPSFTTTPTDNSVNWDVLLGLPFESASVLPGIGLNSSTFGILPISPSCVRIVLIQKLFYSPLIKRQVLGLIYDKIKKRNPCIQEASFVFYV
jgi:hypothetical protein